MSTVPSYAIRVSRLAVWLLPVAVLGATSSLGSCACEAEESSSAVGTDAGSGLDAATDGAAGGSSPDGCTPNVCTPCDCGSIDDGCGGTLECQPCPELQSCTAIYGDVAGFELCRESDDACEFVVTKNGALSCREVCESHGGDCLGAYENGVGCESVYYDAGLGCEASDHDDDVCVCSHVTSSYQPLPCVDASVPPDAEPPPDAGPPVGTTLLYRVDFEDGTIDANPGTSNDETSAAGNGGGSITAVDNPHKDGRNGSDRVGRHQVPDGYRRAELSSQRLPTVDQTYIYKWSYFIPSTFFDATISWNLVSQWKSWPCGDHDGYDTQICGNCGIFNDLSAHPSSFEFKYRAEPDCFTASPPMWTGQWVDFVEEIRWTNDSSGYVKVWQNGSLVHEQAAMKTLFDDFDPTGCNIFWAVGLYANSAEGLLLYTDDIEIWAP